MSEVVSPITKTNDVTHVRELETAIIIRKYKDEYGVDVSSCYEGLDKIDIYECNRTGFKFYSPLGLAGDEKFYEEMQEKMQHGPYYPEWKWENEIAIKHIKKSDKVLEVGCGAGMFLSKLKSQGISTTGLEFNNNAMATCKEKGLEVYKEDIDSFASKHPEEFDVVCHFQVFEHVETPQEFTEACLRALKPKGKLIIGVPHNNPFLYKTDAYSTLNTPPHHVGLWNNHSLTKLAEFNNLKVESVKIEPCTDLNYYFAINFAYLRLHDRIVHRLKFLKYFFEGRNVTAVLVKP